MTVVFIIYLIVLVMWLCKYFGYAPKNSSENEQPVGFDYEAYFNDISNGVSQRVIDKKFKNAAYYKAN